MIDQNPRAQDAPGDAALRAMFTARKQVFIDLLKWDLPALDGRFEIDQFDTPDARYLILLDPDDLRHRASARLLPTSAPHLLGEYYARSEEHTSELQSLMRISYAVFCLKKKNTQKDRDSKLHIPIDTHITSSYT